MKQFLKKFFNKKNALGKYFDLSKIVKKRKIAYVFGSPFHANMGDQAQSYCIEKWLNKNYPDYIVKIYDTSVLSRKNYSLLEYIKKNIKKEDLIILHSGYHTTNLYMREENLQRKVITLFDKKKIIIFPQTINYTDENEARISQEIYGKHSHLFFMCRDSVSYETAQKLFNKAYLCEFPDIVTTMIGERHYDNERSGILLCLRNDKEAFYSKDNIEEMISKLSEFTSVDVTDTTIKEDPNKIINNRQYYLEKIWNDYSKYKLIITDRYHGTIFSLIAGTPVIVLSSTDHKLSLGVKWFPESFGDYIKYVPDLNDVVSKAKEMIDKSYDHLLPDYFNKKYYDHLKEDIEREIL